MQALAHEGPGFRQNVLDALRRVDRALDLAWCGWRKHWIVVRHEGPQQVAYWSGRWHRGFDIVVRWRGAGGVYRALFPRETPEFLPLDNRLVVLVRACDLTRRRAASERFQEMQDVEDDAASVRQARRFWRRDQAEKYAHDRHVVHRVTSVGGFNPGQVNDQETQAEADARMRVSMNRVTHRAPAGWTP